MFFKKLREEIKAARQELAEIKAELLKIKTDASGARRAAECADKSLSALSLSHANAFYNVETAVKAVGASVKELTAISEEEKEKAVTSDQIIDEWQNGGKRDE